MDDFNKISAYLNAHQDEMIEQLCRLIRFPSVSEDVEEVKRCLRAVIKLAKELGFSAKTVLDERVGLVEFGEGSETLGILTHVDVVPAGDPAEWNRPPFEPQVADGKVWGRGTLDDKGAVIASLYALKAVRELGLPFHKKVQMIIGTLEEVQWTDIYDYVKSFPLPDYGFTPDGEFPLCNIEKGFGGVRLSFPFTPGKDSKDGKGTKEEKGTNGENLAGTYSLISIETDNAKNIIPSSCRANLILHGSKKEEDKEIKLTAGGYAVHACMPEKGDNAIINMCNILKSLPHANEQTDQLLSFIINNLAGPYCNTLDLGERSQYHNGEFIHRNCMSPTVIKATGNHIELYMDMRIAYGTTVEEIIGGFETLVAGVGGSVLGNNLEAPTYISRELPFMKAFAQAYERAYGKNEFMLAYGGSYAKAMPNIVSWGPIFPGEDDTCHEPNEYISIKSLLNATEIYSEAIRHIALSKNSFI